MMHIECVNSGPTTQVLTNCGSTGMMKAARKKILFVYFYQEGGFFQLEIEDMYKRLGWTGWENRFLNTYLQLGIGRPPAQTC